MSQKFKRKTLLYRHFAELYGKHWDFSDEALVKMYNFESYGETLTPEEQRTNGFVVGKKWLNWHITNWKIGLTQGSISRVDLTHDVPNVEGYREMVDEVLRTAYDDVTIDDMHELGTWWHVKPPKG